MATAKRKYLLDTNILMTSPYSIYAFDEHDVLICDVTLEELDGLKNAPGERGSHAREAIRVLEELRQTGSLLDGVLLPGGGHFQVLASGFANCVDTSDMTPRKADGIILTRCAEYLKKHDNLVLVTNDINMRLKAEMMKLPAEEYKTEQAAQLKHQYQGRVKAYVSREALDEFYRCGELDVYMLSSFPEDEDHKLVCNEFVLLIDETNEKHTGLARFDGRRLVALKFGDKRPYGIRPKNAGQRFAQEALMAAVSDAPLVILKGPAGTAKTFYSLAVGLEQVLGRAPEYEKILVARPNCKFDEDIGYLKGSEEDKIGPLIRPIYDNLEQLTRADAQKDGSQMKSYTQDLFDRGIVTAQALAYMRGRSITNTWVIIDEAQNMTPLQAFGIISRCGVGTKIILAGDPEQIDSPNLDARTNGLSYASERMKGSPLCWQVTFNDDECVRSPLALEAIHRMSPKGMNRN